MENTISLPVRPIPSYPNYFVTQTGIVLSERKEPLHVTRDGNGYKVVSLKKVISKQYRVHRLVLEAWVGPCPPGQMCRHLDGNKINNHLNNLRWGTALENAQDDARNGVKRGPPRMRKKVGRPKKTLSRGRPPLPKSRRLSYAVNIRLTPAQHRRLLRIVKPLGITVSDWFREKIPPE